MICILGKGMEHQMFDLIGYSSIYCKMDCKVLMDGYSGLGVGAYRIRCRHLYHNSIIS